MANIDNLFRVDGLSLNDEVGIFQGSLDPLITGYEAPLGSLFLRTTGDVYSKTSAPDTGWSIIGSGGGSGVTSVGLSAPSEFTISGSPITSSGTLTLTKTNQNANTVYAGPSSAGPSQPTFRTLSLTSGDISDVSAAAPITGQYLMWDGTIWTTRGGAGIGGGLSIWSGNIASQTGTTTITVGVTPPTTAQGTQIMSQTITPLSVNSKFVIQISLSVSASTNNNIHTCAVFRGTTYIGGAIQTFSSGSNSNAISVTLTDIPNTTGPVTYSVRYGTNANTWYINRRTAENTYGGVRSGWAIQEF